MTRYVWNLAIFSLVAAAYLMGLLAPLDRAIMDLRFDLTQRDASGGLVIVEIDSRSLRELDTWPWPRGYHARLIDRLRAAGAVEIAFDIDFSSKSVPEQDAKMIKALERAEGRVILPAFRQRMRDQSGALSIIETEPIAGLARHSRRGLVNVAVESDGRVRWYATHGLWKGLEIARLGAALSGHERGLNGPFLIDFGIRPETLPRLSYVDVLRGRIDPQAISGKAVIVGATSVELGDTFAVPLHRVLPGVVVQALAHESLVQGRALQPLPPLVPLAIALLLAFFVGTRFAGWSWPKGLAIALGTVAGAVLVSVLLQAAVPFSVDVAPLILIPLFCYAAGLWRVIDLQELAMFRQRLDSAHRRALMQSVVDDSFDGIAIANQNGVIELLNPAAEKILKATAGDAVGTPVHALVPSNRQIADLYAHRNDGENQRAAANVVGPHEFTLAGDDGEGQVIEMIVSSSRLTMKRGQSRKQPVNKAVYIYTFRDITDRKKAEETQRRALEEHAAASRAKSEFMANMSHELRTPLNAIIGFSEIIKSEVLGPVGVEQYADYAGDIYASGSHLLDIINDILDIAKIESGQMTLNEEKVDMAAAIRSCMRLVVERAKEGGVELQTDLPETLPRLRGDERKIKQILSNLLSNAVKFTPEGGKTVVRCRAQLDGRLALTVSDTGIGMAPEDIDVALQNFGQVDSRLQREYEGTGLGLPMVKALATLHDAEFELASIPEQGTTATIRFPAGRVIDEEARFQAVAAQ